MDSPKKQIPPSWDDLVRGSRNATPPHVDVRAYVRAQLEAELRSPSGIQFDTEAGLLDSVLELFARPMPRISLGAGLGMAALLAIVSSASFEVGELTGNEFEVVENFEEALIGEDWTEYL